MLKEVSVKDQLSGQETFYTSFKEAIAKARDGDLITLHKDTNEQMLIDKSINITTAPGVTLKRKRDNGY